MKLYHYTTVYALKSILEEGFLLPVYDRVWFTTDAQGENTAGMAMPEEYKARISVESSEVSVLKVNDEQEKFPHLDFNVLNLITDTSKWFTSVEPINKNKFVDISIMEDGEWIHTTKEEVWKKIERLVTNNLSNSLVA